MMLNVDKLQRDTIHILSPNEFTRGEGLFAVKTIWRPNAGHLWIANLENMWISKNQFLITGFSQHHNGLFSPNQKLRGNLLRVVMPGIHSTFAYVHSYPNGSKIRSGFDFQALQYMSKALHFKFEWVIIFLRNKNHNSK